MKSCSWTHCAIPTSCGFLATATRRERRCSCTSWLQTAAWTECYLIVSVNHDAPFAAFPPTPTISIHRFDYRTVLCVAELWEPCTLSDISQSVLRAVRSPPLAPCDPSKPRARLPGDSLISGEGEWHAQADCLMRSYLFVPLCSLDGSQLLKEEF